MPYEELLKGRISLYGSYYHISTVSFSRNRRFLNFAVSRAAINELRKLDDEGLCQTYAWVLMPNHLHWVFQITGPKSLSEIVRLFKGRSARRINQLTQSKGSVWEQGYYDHGIRGTEDLRNSAEYIINNPVRDGLVEDMGMYPFWDARWLKEDCE